MRFFENRSRHHRAAKIACVATLAQATRKVCILSRKTQHVEFLSIIFCDFFSCRITCAKATTPASPSLAKNITVKPVYNGPVYNGHPVYHGHQTTSRKSCLTFTAILTCIKRSPVYNGHGHPLDLPNPQFHYFLPVYNGHQTEQSQ